eukprot:TRINITY_DN1286_c0_g1_i1.p1 TRINITY_DN1286_c0_g1~~TRINITY_DN1286_c0_g1_i1.p1  ORF type:complete len:587 (+),score=282.39 TRINITY_DN1286_c0_g1_i1:100-1761(+)
MVSTVRLCLLLAAVLGVSMAIDIDGDGFHSDSPVPRFVDCCDTVLECDDPYMVNPGAYDFFGDGVLNDCGQGTTQPILKTPRDAYCDKQNTDYVTGLFTGPATIPSNTEKLALAMDMCEIVDDDDDPTWGFLRQENVVVSLADATRLGYDPKPSTSGPQSGQISMVRRFGRFKPTRDNNFGAMVAISTGTALDLTQAGYIPPRPQFDTTDDVVPLPSPYGNTASSATGDNPCGKPASVYDSLRISLVMRQPTNAEAFAFRVRFLGSEHVTYPTTVPSAGNTPTYCFPDTFVLLKNTSVGTPADHNIASDKTGYAINGNNPNAAFWTACDFYTNFLGNCLESDLDLEFLDYVAASGWQAVGTSASHGEQFRLDFLLFSGTNTLGSDSTVLIDGFAPISEPSLPPLYGYKTTADLSLDHFFVPGNDKAGLLCPGTQDIVLNYKLTNLGVEVANRATVSFTPPFGTSFVSFTGNLVCAVFKEAQAPFQDNDFIKCSSSSANGNIQPLDSLSGTITLRATPKPGQKIRIRLTATSASIDEDYSNNYKIATLFTKIDC